MTQTFRRLDPTILLPFLALILLVFTYGSDPSPVMVVVVGAVLVAAVMTAVHHAEVVAHKVGEPFGSLVLAVAVTVIEVALILSLMSSGGPDADSLARDTVFAAIMITCNGMLGISLLIATCKTRTTRFNAEGTGTALATVATLAVLTLVLPTYTTSNTGPIFSGTQLAFAAIVSVALYGSYVVVQTVRHRDYFLPVAVKGIPQSDQEHAEPPSRRTTFISLGALVVALVGVVGLAKVESKPIEDAVIDAGLPPSLVGVIIAMLVLAPETIAAARAARRGRTQTSFNLAYGSAIASIGLTIPAISIASIWMDGPLILGLESTQIVLLTLTLIVSVLTIVPGRATLQQGAVHLVLFAAFLVLAVNP